jgi:putative LysE/RhtB family amino acid efflux pump
VAQLWNAYGVSLLLAAQVGPITFLIIRSIARGGRAVAIGLAMAGAVAAIDLFYAALGLVGAGQLLQRDGLRLALGLGSATILIVLGARAIWFGVRARHELAFADHVQPTQAFRTAIVATALNPLTIALWTLSFPAAAPASAGHSLGSAATVLVGVAAGTLSWYCGFALLVAALRRRVGARLLPLVEVGTGCALIGYGSLLGYRSVHSDR